MIHSTYYMPAMIQLYIRCPSSSQSSLKQVSKLWNEVSKLIEFKTAALERIKSLGNKLQSIPELTLDHAISIEHIKKDLKNYRLQTLKQVSDDAYHYSVLPIELQHPLSIYLQSNTFESLKFKTIKNMSDAYHKTPEQFISSMSKQLMRHLAKGRKEDALLFFDLALSASCLEPLVALTLSKLLKNQSYTHIHQILGTLIKHPNAISHEELKKHLHTLSQSLPNIKPQYDLMVSQGPFTAAAIWNHIHPLLLELAESSSSTQPREHEKTHFSDEDEILHDDDCDPSAAELSPLDAFQIKLSKIGSYLNEMEYQELRNDALAMIKYDDRHSALLSLHTSLMSREYKVWDWVDEIEELLGWKLDDEFDIEEYDSIFTLTDISESDDSDLIVEEIDESSEEAEEPLADNVPMLSFSQLMKLTPEEWKKRPFSATRARIQNYCIAFPVPEMPGNHAILLEKHQVNAGDSITVVGDLHGCGLRLDLTLKALQKQKILDAEFRLAPGKYLVFLGDYMDRGSNNLKVLEQLMTLKIENPQQVYLIRGNHEDISQNSMQFYTPRSVDSHYRSFMAKSDNTAALAKFYNHLPAALYLGQKNETTGKFEYAQYCHGLFHMYTDPFPILSTDSPHAISWVNSSDTFSSRIQKIELEAILGDNPVNTKKITAIKKLKELSTLFTPKSSNIYWLDVGDALDHLGSGRETIPPIYAKAYLQAMSTADIKIKEIFRGHQKGGLWHSGVKTNKTFITTLDPSQDDDKQIFMTMQTAPKLKAYERKRVVIPLVQDHTKALNKMTVDSHDPNNQDDTIV